MQDRILRGVGIVLGLVLVVLVAAEARNAFEEYHYIGKQNRDRDTITIAGEGKVTARPDVARITVGVQTDGATVREVQQKNTERMTAVINAVKTMGVAEKDIQTSQFSVSPQYEWKDGRSRVIGYQVVQQATVKVRDLDKAGDILARVGDAGANTVSGPDFVIDEPMKLREEARAKAIADARAKAGQLASDLGVDLGPVVNFSEASAGMPYPMPMLYKAEVAMDASAGNMAAPPIEAGSSDVMANVSITFELR